MQAVVLMALLDAHQGRRNVNSGPDAAICVVLGSCVLRLGLVSARALGLGCGMQANVRV